MTDERVHRARSADGTEIAGRVHGQGPALILVHGALPDGDLAWEAMVPHLSDRFTCYLPSLRGRGLSEDSQDHSPPRLEEDVRAFVDSIGGSVFLVGWSAGVPWSLSAAAHSGAVTAVAGYEPTIIPLMEGDAADRRDAMYRQFGEAAADGRLADAARAFHTLVCNDNELVLLEAEYFELCAASVPALVQDAQHSASYEGTRSTDPDVLEEITAPFLLLRGAETELDGFYTDTERYVADHVVDPLVGLPLPGLGHMGPMLAPEPIAKQLVSFFESS